jgi:formiminotetrahydrofolate cyclodeaminase
MGTAELIKLVAEQGSAFALAVFTILVLNKVWKLRLEEVKRYAADLKEMNCQMREAIDRNTEAWMKMMERVKG